MVLSGKLLAFLQQREGNSKSAAFTRNAGSGDTTVVVLDDLLRDIKAKADARATACLDINFRNTVKAFKNMRKFFWRDTNAMIFDRDNSLIILARNPHGNDKILWRVLAGI